MQTINQKITAAAGYASSIGGRTLMIQGCDQGTVLTLTLTDSFGNRDTLTGIGAGAKLTPAAGFTKVEITTPVDANVTFIVTNGDIDVQLSQLGSTITNTNLNPVPVAIVSEPGAPFQVSAPVGQEVNVKVQGTVAVTGANLTATNVGINNTSANPVPVMLHASDDATAIPVSGTVAVSGTVPVSGAVNVTPTQAATVTDAAPVAVAAFNSGSPNQVHIRTAGACRSLRIGNPIASTGKLYVGGAGVTPTNAVIVLQPGDVWNETDAPQIDWYATSDTGATANMQVIA